MNQVVIIADDLSGAADCASTFVKAGLETVVVIDRDAPAETGDDAVKVIAIDADTRRLPSNEAGRIHRDLFNRYCSPDRLLFKKIDSTLRGNFPSELKAIIAYAGLAIVAPAFPQAGRYTRHGCQFLNDTPLEETEIWRVEGIRGTAHIPGMLKNNGIQAASVSREEIHEGSQRLRTLFERLADNGVQAIVCDAETDDDLQTITEASIELACPHFWVGSAGLASQLPAAANLVITPHVATRMSIRGSILTVIGSLSSASRQQADYLVSSGLVERLELSASTLRGGELHPDWQSLRARLAMRLQGRHDLLLEIASVEVVDLGEGVRLCHALAQLVAPFAEQLGAIVATGGETARAIVTAMGSTGLRVIGEVETGVPISLALGAKTIPIITKAGAFGTRETLFRCYETLRLARDEPVSDWLDVSLATINAVFPMKAS